MPNHSLRTFRLMFWVILVLLGGCAGKDINDSDPAILFKDAEEDIQSDRYQLALDKLNTVKNKFPYSNYSVDAKLRIADVYYLQESYADAAEAYNLFLELHPKHPKAPYALFKKGESYFESAPSKIARDLSPLTKAYDAYELFSKQFPQDPSIPNVKEKMEKTRKLLAEKEYSIGHYYFIRDFYESSLLRFQKLANSYTDTASATLAQPEKQKAETFVKTRKKADIEMIQDHPKYHVYTDRNE